MGHVTTVFSIIFFFLCIADSKFVNAPFVIYSMGTPRLNKRIVYYLHKIINTQYNSLKVLITKNYYDVMYC